MSGVIRRSAPARNDLIGIVRHYAREAGLRTADRFLVASEGTFKRLASMPGLGTRYDSDHPLLNELRFFPISSRFKMYLVFYRPTSDGIEVVRVLHGARDIESVLARDLGLDTGEPGVLATDG
jgi:toxin ParE1/3/4